MTEAFAFPEPSDDLSCSLCGTVSAVTLVRCPQCGLYRGDPGEPPPSRAVVARLVAGFAAVYLVTLLIVALAR
jgi:hypothetical protein